MSNYITAEEIVRQVRMMPVQERARLKDILYSDNEDKSGLKERLTAKAVCVLIAAGTMSGRTAIGRTAPRSTSASAAESPLRSRQTQYSQAPARASANGRAS